MLKKSLLVLAFLVMFAQPAFSTSYKIAPAHSEVGFTVEHLMFFKVRSYFTDYVGTIEADTNAKTLTATTATIKTTSVNTRIEKRDNHPRSADFFDVAKFPEMSFVSKKIEGSGKMKELPTLFVSHGAPDLIISKEPARQALINLGPLASGAVHPRGGAAISDNP